MFGETILTDFIIHADNSGAHCDSLYSCWIVILWFTGKAQSCSIEDLEKRQKTDKCWLSK